MKVRTAVPDDFPAIMELCRLLYLENGATKVNWETVQNTIFKGINGEMATLGVIGPSSHLEGMIYIRFASMWYSDELILEEIYNFVHPNHRRSKNARSLTEFAKQASDKLGVPLLIGIISNERTAAKIRLYERTFGKPSGAYFLYNARTGQKDE